MKKRIVSLVLALCLLNANCLTVFADEAEPASQESTPETMTAETQEQTQPPPEHFGKDNPYPATDHFGSAE